MSVTLTSPSLQLDAAAPLGAHYDGQGASFGVFSGAAEAVELCLFDS